MTDDQDEPLFTPISAALTCELIAGAIICIVFWIVGMMWIIGLL